MEKQKRKKGVNINTYVDPDFKTFLEQQGILLGWPTFSGYVRQLLIEGSKNNYKHTNIYDSVQFQDQTDNATIG